MSTEESKIIEVSREHLERVTTRRLEDISLRMKAARYDQMILEAQFEFERGAKLAHGPYSYNAAFGHGLAHFAKRMLWYADIKPDCPCKDCTTRRMEKLDCAKTAEGQ